MCSAHLRNPLRSSIRGTNKLLRECGLNPPVSSRSQRQANSPMTFVEAAAPEPPLKTPPLQAFPSFPKLGVNETTKAIMAMSKQIEEELPSGDPAPEVLEERIWVDGKLFQCHAG
jgi:hypothetical protein